MSETSRVVAVESASDWESILEQADAQESTVVAFFSASWCAPCKYMAKTFNDMSKRCHRLIFLEVDVDELTDVGAKMQVKAMPTFLFVKDHSVIDKLVGANKDELIRKIAKLSSS